MEWIRKSARFLSARLALLCVAALAMMSLNIVVDVFMRTFFNRGILASVDTVQLLMVMVIFTSFANTQLQRGHLKVELLTERLKPRTEEILSLIMLVLGLAFTCVMLQQTALEAYKSWKVNEYTFGFVKYPIWPAKMFMPLGLVVLSWQFFADLLESSKRLLQGKLFKGRG